MNQARDPGVGLLDWRIVAMVLAAHACIFVSAHVSFDFFKKEPPLEIAIEISGVSEVVAGAKESIQARQAVAEKKTTQAPKELKPDPKPSKPQPHNQADIVESVPHNSSSGSTSAQQAQVAVPAGGMQSAPQARPDVAAKVTKNPKPIYPKKAYEDREEGTVILNVEVLETGKTGRINLAKTSGVTSLDVSAIEAVKLWQFVPAKAGGQVVRQWVQIPIKFSLAREGAR